MLPGFRFLVAAIVFSLSILIFGLGAAALLRAAHEQFASTASWHATAPTGFTTFLPQPDPVLAVLRVEPKAPEPIVQPAIVEAAAPPSSDGAAPATPADRIASAEASASATESASRVATAAAPATAPEAHAASADLTLARPAEMSGDVAGDNKDPSEIMRSAASAPESATSEPARTPAPDTMPPLQHVADAAAAIAVAPPPAAAAGEAATKASDPIAVKIAALATEAAAPENQAVAGETTASVKVASVQLHRSVVKRRLARERERLAARRAKQRRLALRARAARQAALAQQQQQQAADPFGQQPGFGQQAGFGQQPPFGQQPIAQRTR